jgi:hypothetical protein
VAYAVTLQLTISRFNLSANAQSDLERRPLTARQLRQLLRTMRSRPDDPIRIRRAAPVQKGVSSMQRLFTPALILILALLAFQTTRIHSVSPAVNAQTVSAHCEIRALINGTPGPWRTVDPAQYPEFCSPPSATTTATAHLHPPSSVAPQVSGWHAPTDHEHGDMPPAWVLASGHAPFAQSRESHSGYKGASAAMANGVESYFIAHIVSTKSARSHGDHDYQLWIKDPSGGISYWQGTLDFGSPPPLRTNDTGERPIILSVGDDGCETWYSRPGAAVVDVGWTICGRYEAFAGSATDDTGTFRTIDWIIPAERLGAFPGAATTLAQYCQIEYDTCRFSFIVNSKDYDAPGVRSIN